MTTRNLNTTWRDIVLKQYAADFEAGVPFPVRYLINIPAVYGLPGRDIWIEIQTKIDLKTFKKAIVAFGLATRHFGDPTYQDDHISVSVARDFPITQGKQALIELTVMTMRKVLGVVLGVMLAVISPYSRA